MAGIIMHAPGSGARYQTCCPGLAIGCFLYDTDETRQQFKQVLGSEFRGGTAHVFTFSSPVQDAVYLLW